MLECDSIIWEPSEEMRLLSYVYPLMKRLGVTSISALRQKSIEDIGLFWDVVMQDLGIEWFRPYTRVLDSTLGIAWTRWFLDGKINIVHNCVDRHLKTGQANEIALLWEGDDGTTRSLTYRQFSDEIGRAANAIKSLGVGQGDSVGILMPMVPEVVIALFACFKIGAVAIPIFSGFGSEAVSHRLREAGAKVLFTSDIALRRGKRIESKVIADEACCQVPTIKAKIVFRRGTDKCTIGPNDHWWHEFMPKQSTQCLTEALDSETQCLILFTSGTTGTPKGTIHTHAGCLSQIGKEHRYVFNVDGSTRFFWFTDIGWMMGPWEMIGVTLFGGTLFLYEGAPDYPSPSRLWEMIERHQLSVLGISPTAIRLLMTHGEKNVSPFPMKSLKYLGSTGEPWDPQSYLWYFNHVGKKRSPIINISGGTEIIGCLLSTLPVEPMKVCALGGPGLGVDADVFDEQGKSVRRTVGHLVCKQPLPSMTKGFLNAPERYLETYFLKFPGVWYHGDWALVDADGHWFLQGRSDDTIKIAGKRIGPAEVEAALMTHPTVSEAAAIGVPDPIKGESCVCFVVLKSRDLTSETLRHELKESVIKVLGKALAPKEIRFVHLLPKTRSAKILRGLIRKIHLKEKITDTSSVENLEAIAAITQSS